VTELSWLAAPLAGCTVSVLILGYLGLHVLGRQVIFVDLALAQIAALGATFAFYLGFDPDSGMASVFALLFCLGGAAVFAGTRAQEYRLPQEAIIGVCYVVAAAGAILLVDLAHDPHGGERIRFLLVGSIVWATWTEIGIAAVVCAAVGIFHVVFRKRLAQASFDMAGLREDGASLVLWDLLFYASFGVAITVVVPMIGVLLVFSYLIIPASVAVLFFDGHRARILVTWGLGLAVSVVGLLFGYEHPPGPVIVACFGVVLAVALMLRSVFDAPRPAHRALALGVGLVLLVVSFRALPTVLNVQGGHSEHGHEHEKDLSVSVPADESTELESIDGGLASEDLLVRQRAIDRLVEESSERSTQLLLTQLERETDDELSLRVAGTLHTRGRAEGRAGLERLSTESSVPFVRLKADELLGGAK
jgi:zinc/manganese transport system permease protein